MAKYTIEHICGHSEDMQIYGPTRERQGKADWLASRDCAECYARKLQAQRAEASAQAAAQSAAAGLPALTGSDKQVAWAESIRAAAVAILIPLRDKLRNPPRALSAEEITAQSTAISIVEAALARTSAHEWIESRATIYDVVWLKSEVRKQQEVMA